MYAIRRLLFAIAFAWEVKAGYGGRQFAHWKGTPLEEWPALADNRVCAAATIVRHVFYPTSSSDIRCTAYLLKAEHLLPGH